MARYTMAEIERLPEKMKRMPFADTALGAAAKAARTTQIDNHRIRTSLIKAERPKPRTEIKNSAYARQPGPSGKFSNSGKRLSAISGTALQRHNLAKSPVNSGLVAENQEISVSGPQFSRRFKR